MLEPANIRQCWDWVRPGVERVIAKSGERCRPEDVYAAVVNGSAQLWTSEDGFVVWYIDVCPYSGRRSLWIWMGWSEAHGMFEKYGPQLRDMARRADAERVAFNSPRKGYSRRLSAPWRVARVEYEMEA